MSTKNLHRTGGHHGKPAQPRQAPQPAPPSAPAPRFSPASRLAAAFVLYLLLRWAVFGSVAPITCSDTASYIDQFRNGFGEGFFGRARSWAYPLAFWLAGFNTGLVVVAQQLAGVLAWFALAWAGAGLFRSAAARRIVFWGTLILSLSLNAVIWDAMLLSESFSNSFFIALSAAWIAFLGARGAGLRALAALAALAIPFAGLRDSNLFPLYFLAGSASLELIFRLKHAKRFPPESGAPELERGRFWIGQGLAALVVLICLGHSWDMKACHRNWQSVGASISIRICSILTANEAGQFYSTPNEANIAWLARRYGLPAEEARARNGKTCYQAPPLSPAYENWIKQTGPSALLGFMASHPAWVLQVFGSTPIYNQSAAEVYMKSPELWQASRVGLSRAIQRAVHLTVDKIFFMNGINILITLAAGAAGLGWAARAWLRGPDAWTRRLGALFWLLGCSAMIVFISIFGDYFEPWRHSITGMMAFYAALPLSLAAAIEMMPARRGNP